MDIDATLNKLTLQQKCTLLAGSDFWHTAGIPQADVPSFMITDGPHGLRKQEGQTDHVGLNQSVPSTCFPTASALACSFDVDLLRMVGAALGHECRKEEVGVILGPGASSKRSPLCGRNFEYFSEDPLLTGFLSAAYIRGVQSQGVGCSLKHFAGNNQETNRLVIDSVIDERALREVYLRGFELAVRHGRPWTVMCAYNRLNGTFCCENRRLLTDILRKEWGFDGVVVTDWGALDKSIESVEAGLDLVMPGVDSPHPARVQRAVEDGTLSQAAVDDAVRRMLQLIGRVQQGAENPAEYSEQQNLQIACLAAEESAVLLKNDGVLPLGSNEDVAVIGAFATQPRYQGAGSSRINPTKLDCAWDVLHARMPQAVFESGYDADTGAASEDQLRSAIQAARDHRTVLLFAGLPASWESEGFDRTTMDMPASQVDLIRQVCRVNPRTVVVLQGGSPMDTSWRDEPAAILLMYLAGCQSGRATADLLLGDAVPSGKLAETWPLSADDSPCTEYPCLDHENLYTESLFTGYRYYDTAKKDVAFPFGFGLSYTDFAYRDLAVEKRNGVLQASFTVANVGRKAGKEVVQLYITPCHPGVPMARQTLQAFAKIELAPGAQHRVEFKLGSQAFSYWDVQAGEWTVEAGDYEIRVGSSSRDIRLRATVAMRGTPRATIDEKLRCYYAPSEFTFDVDSFMALYGRALPDPVPVLPFTENSTIADVSDTMVGKVIRHYSNKQLAQTGSDEESRRMMAQMMDGLPLRNLAMGGVAPHVIEAVVLLANRHWWRGIKALLGKSST